MKLNAANFPNLRRIYCSDQQCRAKITRFNGRYFFAFATYRAISITAADGEEDTFTAEDFARIQDVKAYDSNGNEIFPEYDPATGEITFADMPASFSYNYDTGFNGVKMDVTATAEADDSGDSEGAIGSSGGGCESGFGIFALIIFSVPICSLQ